LVISFPGSKIGFANTKSSKISGKCIKIILRITTGKTFNMNIRTECHNVTGVTFSRQSLGNRSFYGLHLVIFINLSRVIFEGK
jgi:hypothetical protein